MYKKIILLLLFTGILSTQAQIKSPQPSPASTLTQIVGLTEVTVEYSRPAMRGRTIFGDLVPYGALWRTGANANTKITFSDDVRIDGKTLKKGTYALYSKPQKDQWELIFYTDSNNWGNPQSWDESKVALKTSVPTQVMPMTIESFTISIDHITNDTAVLGLLWENTYVGLKIAVPTEAITMKSIADVMSGPSANDYFSAASYYRTTGKDLNQALKWISKATKMNDKAFWMFREKSLIHAALGDKKNAIAAAKKSMAIAQEAKNADYVKMNKESIEKWSN
ncbi:DUF2911 domain-containing protein [Flavobacteriaceae bacterium F08102]|nr:DUF2911 domain-containing protein [Flavobacteriaceae bacterium F08102]